MDIYTKKKNNNKLRYGGTEDDMDGKKFGKWTVVSFSHRHPKAGNWYYSCVCDCGCENKLCGSKLRRGLTSQCRSCAGKINGRKGLYRKGLYGKNAEKDLYFVRCGDYIKIGISGDVERRLKDLESSNPFELELIYRGVGEGGDEEFWHGVFKQRHHRGEWFEFKTEIAA